MAQHKLFTSESGFASKSGFTSDRGMAPLRETRSSSNGAVPHTTLLCDEPHVLFNNALLYSGQALTRGQRFQA